MISKILISNTYEKWKLFRAVLPEGRVLVYLFLAFLARHVLFKFFFKAPMCLDFSNISWDIARGFKEEY